MTRKYSTSTYCLVHDFLKEWWTFFRDIVDKKSICFSRKGASSIISIIKVWAYYLAYIVDVTNLIWASESSGILLKIKNSQPSYSLKKRVSWHGAVKREIKDKITVNHFRNIEKYFLNKGILKCVSEKALPTFSFHTAEENFIWHLNFHLDTLTFPRPKSRSSVCKTVPLASFSMQVFLFT